MSGLFGYFDPYGELPLGTVQKMAVTMGSPADRSTVILRGDAFAIGCISKKIYPGEGKVLTGDNPQRKCLFTGRLLGFTGQSQTANPLAAARTAFLDDAAPACLSSANGPFAAAVWDDGGHQLELITDRYGMYPLYVARCRSAVLFAGQIKALLIPGILRVEFDPVAVALMLSIGEMVDELTLIRAVRLLPAGSKSIFSAEGNRTIRYWQYSFSEDETDFDGAAHRLGHLLHTAVERICLDSASLGVPLSGGLDSRVLLAAAPHPTSVPSFTWGLAGCRDLRYAAATAQVVRSPHRGFEYEGDYLEQFAALGVWITEGQLPCVDFHVLPYVEKVAGQCNIILNGYAGDAVLGGSFVKPTWWRAGNRKEAGAAIWRWRDSMLRPCYRRRIMGSALSGCTPGDAQAAFVDCYFEAHGSSPMDAAMAFLLDNRVRRRTLCGTNLMRWGVESDQPFFDNDFFDCAMHIPHGWRFHHRLYLRMVRTSFSEVAKVPWQRTGLPAGAAPWLTYISLGLHRLDRYAACRPLFRSRQVSDFDGWMRGPLQSFVVEVLNDPRTLDRGLCDADTVRAVVDDHMSGTDNSALLGSLLALELFARLFVDCDLELVERCIVSVPPAQIIHLDQVT